MGELIMIRRLHHKLLGHLRRHLVPKPTASAPPPSGTPLTTNAGATALTTNGGATPLTTGA
jgi:hypothetical protein